jgi:hypothetical protein
VHPFLGTLFGWRNKSMVRRLLVVVTDDALVSRINIGEDKEWVHLQFHRTVRAAAAVLSV